MSETISFKFVPLADSIIKEIDYDEVLGLFSKLETCIFIIGEKGEAYTENVMDFVNKLAKKHNITNVYLFDPTFINVYGEKENMIDCKSLEVKLKYYKLVELLKFKNQELCKDTLIPKIHTPFISSIRFGSMIEYIEAPYDRKDGKLVSNNEDITISCIDELSHVISDVKLDYKLIF